MKLAKFAILDLSHEPWTPFQVFVSSALGKQLVASVWVPEKLRLDSTAVLTWATAIFPSLSIVVTSVTAFSVRVYLNVPSIG